MLPAVQPCRAEISAWSSLEFRVVNVSRIIRARGYVSSGGPGFSAFNDLAASFDQAHAVTAIFMAAIIDKWSVHCGVDKGEGCV